MKKLSLLIIKALLFIAVFIALERLCHKQTKGFTIANISSNADLDPSWALALPSPEQKVKIAALLDQPFHFLGCGGECYAFESADKQTVIKFFKHHPIRIWNWAHRIPLPNALGRLRSKALEKQAHRSPLFFESCKIAYEEFQERSGLIYLHLHQSDYFEKKVTIIDRLGIAHQIDPNHTHFALQQKVEMPYIKFKKLIKARDIPAAKKCIDSILDLIQERATKGISDRDPNIRKNLGFIGTQAVEIDLGSFSRGTTTKRNLFFETDKFKSWLEQRSPELSSYLSERIRTLSLNNL